MGSDPKKHNENLSPRSPNVLNQFQGYWLLFDVISIVTTTLSYMMQRVDASYDGSEAIRVPVPKVYINGKISTRLEINVKN
jgi:hypothetical protein